jgi:hypothetical protein
VSAATWLIRGGHADLEALRDDQIVDMAIKKIERMDKMQRK